MRCPQCGKENDEKFKFCLGCGAGLEASGTAESAGSAGVADAESAGAPPPGPPGGMQDNRDDAGRGPLRARKRGLVRSLVRILAGIVVVLLLAVGVGWYLVVHMPGTSYTGALPPMTDAERELSARLRHDVEKLAGEIGVRCIPRYEALREAEGYISSELEAAGTTVRRQEYQVDGKTCANLEAEIPGGKRAEEILVVGAHYDTVPGAPGADDNGSAVAGLLALARACAGKEYERTVRFVAFVNEEPPYFQTERMGSLVYARACKERGEKLAGAMVLEMLGCYSDAEGSQHYPPPLSWFYPSVGDFIGFVGNLSSRSLVHEMIASFRGHTRFPSEGAAAPEAIPGIGFSDHWSFWQVDVPAVMVTDTAFFRYPHYHEPTDTPDRLDYDRMARVVAGLERVIDDLAGERE